MEGAWAGLDIHKKWSRGSRGGGVPRCRFQAYFGVTIRNVVFLFRFLGKARAFDERSLRIGTATFDP